MATIPTYNSRAPRVLMVAALGFGDNGFDCDLS